MEAKLAEFVVTPDHIAFKIDADDRVRYEGTLRRVGSAYGGMTCAGKIEVKDHDGTTIGTVQASCTFQKKDGMHILRGTWLEVTSLEDWHAELSEEL